jgi:hypothetical protein
MKNFEICNRFFLLKYLTWFLVFRIPGSSNGHSFLYIWISKQSTLKITVKIWKIKFTLELG